MIVSIHDESLAAYVSKVTTLPGERYARTPPRRVYYCDAGAERAYAGHYGNVAGQLPPQALYRLTDAVVRGLGIISFGEAIIRENLMGVADIGNVETWVGKERAPRQTIEEPVLYLLRMGVKNYGHSLTDIIPRLHWFHEHHPEVRIIVYKDMPASILEALKLVGISESKLVRLGNEVTRLKTMYFMDQWNNGPLVHSGKIFSFLARLKKNALGPQRGARELPRRLFVTRDDASSRRISNHAEVARLLKARGFTEIACGRMPLQEQISRFDAAECVAGICGAALTNLVFCRPGTNILNMAPSTMPAVYFWDLAHHAGLTYDIAYFPPTDTAKGQGSDFLADAGVLEQLLPA